MRLFETDPRSRHFAPIAPLALICFALPAFALDDAPAAVCRLSFSRQGVELGSCEATLVNERDLLTTASCLDTTVEGLAPIAICGEERKAVTLTRVHEGFQFKETIDPKNLSDQLLMHSNMAILSLPAGEHFKVKPAKMDLYRKVPISRCAVAIYENEAARLQNKATMADLKSGFIAVFGSGDRLYASKTIARETLELVGTPMFCKDVDNNYVLKGLVSMLSSKTYFYTRVDQNGSFLTTPSGNTNIK
jgi:hypothetical protein